MTHILCRAGESLLPRGQHMNTRACHHFGQNCSLDAVVYPVQWGVRFIRNGAKLQEQLDMQFPCLYYKTLDHIYHVAYCFHEDVLRITALYTLSQVWSNSSMVLPPYSAVVNPISMHCTQQHFQIQCLHLLPNVLHHYDSRLQVALRILSRSCMQICDRHQWWR